MKRSIKEILNYQVETKDLVYGNVADFLFDEKLWFIRYLKVDFGNLFNPEKVLLPKVFLKRPRWKKKQLPAALNISDIDKCPKIENHLPVSRKYEEQLHKHFELKPYWYSAYSVPMGLAFYTPRQIRVPSEDGEFDEEKSILRSFIEIESYQIEAIDGKFGHIEDLIIDDKNWQITYVVVDTSNWLPWSKKVLISVDQLSAISYSKREVKINLYIDKIKSAPAYDPTDLINEDYERGLHDFYSRSLVK